MYIARLFRVYVSEKKERVYIVGLGLEEKNVIICLHIMPFLAHMTGRFYVLLVCGFSTSALFLAHKVFDENLHQQPQQCCCGAAIFYPLQYAMSGLPPPRS